MVWEGGGQSSCLASETFTGVTEDQDRQFTTDMTDLRWKHEIDLELVSTRTFVVTHFIRTFVVVVINCLEQKGQGS